MSKILRFPSTDTSTDDAAREAALDIRRSCIVEAPAGSGKTGLLMQRFLKLLADESVQQPEEVLAITFTNKATAELKERIHNQLQASYSERPLPATATPFDFVTRALAEAVLIRDHQLQWQLLARPHRLNIRTIDSVCAEIANATPLLSSANGPRKPTLDPAPLYHQAAQRTLMQLGGSDLDLHQSLRTLLLHRDANLADVESLIANMLGQREQWGELIPLNPADLNEKFLDTQVRTRLEHTLEFLVCSALTRTLREFPPAALADITLLARHIGAMPPFKDNTPHLAICADKSVPPADAAEHLDHWLALANMLLTQGGGWRRSIDRSNIGHDFDLRRDKPVLQQLIADLQSAPNAEAILASLAALRTLPPARYPDEQWRVAKALFHVLRRALAELRVLFAETAECDFTEIALAAREALTSDDTSTDLALTSGGHLRHLLVDEMQDTSASQYELIDLLTRSWDGASQTLFLVGDPKQSIYLFRQARVERFLRTMREERFAEIPLQSLRLTSNFRSQASLVHSFNGIFSELFPQQAEAVENLSTDAVPFIAAHPTRDSTDTNDVQWHAEILADQQTKAAHPKHQAQTICEVIQYWLDQPLPPDHPAPWRIAVLARNRSHLDQIVTQLKRASIAYRAVDIDPLDTVPEVLDILALTRALLHPADRVAWLAVLHAPWCGLGLGDLLTLTGDGPDPDPCATIATLIAKRGPLLSPDAQSLLNRTWPTLQTAIDSVGRAPLDVQIERAWLSLGGDAPLTAPQRANVYRYLALLRDLLSETGRVDLTTLTARLKKLYAEPTAGDIQVELLTIHKAKGLEWDVVLVPSLERKSGTSTGDLLNWLEIDGTPPEASPVILAPIWGKGYDSDRLNKWLNAARDAREEAERKRLFYVLCTRAREELHLFGACTLKVDGSPATPASGSLLKAVWPAASAAFAQTTGLHQDINQKIERPPEIVDYYDDGLDIAAVSSTTFPQVVIDRLPAAFVPQDRFLTPPNIPYAPPSFLQYAHSFNRPEGSLAVRAFGNVVHRYLQLLADLLTQHPQPDITGWQPRLLASLRGEGIPPSLAAREAVRAHLALTQALADPTGLWILSPHATAASEQPIATQAGTLRADRTFLAGDTPLTRGDTHIWIVDFKTGEQGSRTDAAFEAAELAKYQPQLEAYAALRLTLPQGDLPIRLGLYYPLIPRLLHWSSSLKSTTSGSRTILR